MFNTPIGKGRGKGRRRSGGRGRGRSSGKGRGKGGSKGGNRGSGGRSSGKGNTTIYSVALIIIVQDPSGYYHILCVRKCFGGDKHNLSERAQVGHFCQNGQLGNGAAGTNPIFWGQWCTIGGSASPKANNPLHAAILEFRDEVCVNHTISKHLNFNTLKQHNYVNKSTYVFYATLPWDIARMCVSPHVTNKNVIFSSHGEIAQVKLFRFDQFYLSNNSLAHLSLNSNSLGFVPYVTQSILNANSFL